MKSDPLYNQEAEEAVLAAMLMDPKGITTAQELLVADAFYQPIHQTLFRAILNVVSNGAPIDPVNLFSVLEATGDLTRIGGRDFIWYLLDVIPTAANVQYHAKIVRDLADRRATVAVAESLVQMAQDRSIPLQQTAQQATQALLPAAASMTRGGYRHVFDIAQDVADDIEAAARGDALGLSWGYRDIDAATGGLLTGELALLCAVPGAGKTAFALNIGMKTAERGEGVGVVSAEMKDRALVKRLVSNRAQVNGSALRKGTLAESEYVRLGQALGDMRTLPIWVDDTPTPNIELILARARALKAKHPNIRLVILDFIQLIEGMAGSEDNRARELSVISYKLKGLAKELDVGVIATCQVDAANIEKRVDRRPQLSDLRWSQAMREAGDFVVLQYRPAMYDEAALDVLEVVFAKARELAPFKVTLNWIGKFMRVEDQPRLQIVHQTAFPGVGA